MTNVRREYRETLKAPTKRILTARFAGNKRIFPQRRKITLYSEDLLQGEEQITIMHDGVEYRLRNTSQNKLILTK